MSDIENPRLMLALTAFRTADRDVPRGFLMCNRFCKKKLGEGWQMGGGLWSSPKKIRKLMCNRLRTVRIGGTPLADDSNRSTSSYEHVTIKSRRTTTPSAHCKDVNLLVIALVIIFPSKHVNYCSTLGRCEITKIKVFHYIGYEHQMYQLSNCISRYLV